MSEETVKVRLVSSVSMFTAEVSVADLESLGFTRTVVKPWKPVDGEGYWHLDAQGWACESEWEDDRFDVARWDIDNCYKTEAEATKVSNKQLATVRVLRRLRELEGGWVADFKSRTQAKATPLYEHVNKTLHIANSAWTTQPEPYDWYSTKEAWEQVIEELELDVKRMMGV